jgi:hypothetical protein
MGAAGATSAAGETSAAEKKTPYGNHEVASCPRKRETIEQGVHSHNLSLITNEPTTK